MAGSDVDHVFSNLLNDLGNIHTGGAVSETIRTGGALKQGLDEFISGD